MLPPGAMKLGSDRDGSLDGRWAPAGTSGNTWTIWVSWTTVGDPGSAAAAPWGGGVAPVAVVEGVVETPGVVEVRTVVEVRAVVEGVGVVVVRTVVEVPPVVEVRPVVEVLTAGVVEVRTVLEFPGDLELPAAPGFPGSVEDSGRLDVTGLVADRETLGTPSELVAGSEPETTEGT